MLDIFLAVGGGLSLKKISKKTNLCPCTEYILMEEIDNEHFGYS